MVLLKSTKFLQIWNKILTNDEWRLGHAEKINKLFVNFDSNLKNPIIKRSRILEKPTYRSFKKN